MCHVDIYIKARGNDQGCWTLWHKYVNEFLQECWRVGLCNPWMHYSHIPLNELHSKPLCPRIRLHPTYFYLSINCVSMGSLNKRIYLCFYLVSSQLAKKIWSARSNSLTAGRLDFAYAQPRLSTRTCWIFVPHWKLLQRWFWWEVVRTLQMRERSSLYFFGLLQCPSTGSCNSTKDAKYRYCFFMALCQHLAPEIH